MGRIDNLKADQLSFLRQTRQLGAQTPLKHTSVTDGQTRFIGEHSLVIVGSADVDGTLNVDGEVNATGDVNVTGGGKVNVGSAMVLDPGVSSGAIVFSNGAQIFTDGTSVQVFKGSSAATVTSDSVTISNGSYTVVCDSGGLKMFGLPAKSGTGLLAGLLWRDPTTGALQRITS